MPTYRFFDDYSEGAHPRVLEVLADSNLQQEPGYGHDGLTARAIALLRAAIGNASAAVASADPMSDRGAERPS